MGTSKKLSSLSFPSKKIYGAHYSVDSTVYAARDTRNARYKIYCGPVIISVVPGRAGPVSRRACLQAQIKKNVSQR